MLFNLHGPKIHKSLQHRDPFLRNPQRPVLGTFEVQREVLSGSDLPALHRVSSVGKQTHQHRGIITFQESRS